MGNWCWEREGVTAPPARDSNPELWTQVLVSLLPDLDCSRDWTGNWWYFIIFTSWAWPGDPSDAFSFWFLLALPCTFQLEFAESKCEAMVWVGGDCASRWGQGRSGPNHRESAKHQQQAGEGPTQPVTSNLGWLADGRWRPEDGVPPQKVGHSDSRGGKARQRAGRRWPGLRSQPQQPSVCPQWKEWGRGSSSRLASGDNKREEVAGLWN